MDDKNSTLDLANKLFMVESASHFMADFINPKNCSENFSWKRWYDMCFKYVNDQCELQNIDFDESFISCYLDNIIKKIGN